MGNQAQEPSAVQICQGQAEAGWFTILQPAEIGNHSIANRGSHEVLFAETSVSEGKLDETVAVVLSDGAGKRCGSCC